MTRFLSPTTHPRPFTNETMLERLSHFPVLQVSSAFSVIVPAMVGLFCCRGATKPMQLLSILFMYYIIEVIASTIMATHYVNNLWIGYFTGSMEYSIIAFVFSLWSKNGIARQIIKTSIPVYLIISIIAILSFQKITHNGSFTIPLEWIILASMSVYTLVNLVDEHETKLTLDPRFWVSISVVIYGLGTAPYFTVYNMLGSISRDIAFKVAAVNWVLTIVANVLYAIAFIADRASAMPEQHSKGLAEL